MKDRIDERNERERIAKSVVKFWNVNYIPRPQYEEPQAAEEQAGTQQDAAWAEEMAAKEHEEAYNVTTGSYSGEYGKSDVEDEVTKGQIEKILHEKTDAIRSLIEQNEEQE